MSPVQLDSPRFGRVVTAMVTPFGDDGALDVPAAVEVRGEDALGLRDAGAGPRRILAEGHRTERERAYPQARGAEGDVAVEWHCLFLRSSKDGWIAPFHGIALKCTVVGRSSRLLA